MLAHLITQEEYIEYLAEKRYEEGLEEGKKIGMIKSLFMDNATDDEIIELTKITPEELEKYKKEFDI